MNVKEIGKDLAHVALDSIEIKIDLVKLGDGILDQVVEKALDEVVKDSANIWDDQAKAFLWPYLQPKLKEVVEKELGKIQKDFEAKLAEVKAKVLA
jgi:hypothetical protein